MKFPKKHVEDDFVMCVTVAKGIVQKFFLKTPENFCTPARILFQSLTNRMVKTVFGNSKFLPLKINSDYIQFRHYGSMYGRNFLNAIFNGKNIKFPKTVFTMRFVRLWRRFLAWVQKFSGISKKFCTIPFANATYMTKSSFTCLLGHFILPP